jgi:hypothetical protein
MDNTGIKLIWKKEIDPTAWEIIQKFSHHDFSKWVQYEVEMGVDRVKKLVPDATLRTYCDCCYGNGPTILYTQPYQDRVDAEFSFSVDYDFKIPEEQC